MPQQRPTTLADALELFILDCRAQRFTKSTIGFYQGRLSLFLKWCAANGITLLHELTATDIKRFFVHLQSKSLSSAYVHSHARAIRTFCNFCVRDELSDKSPFAKVKMPQLEKKLPKALSKAEITAILKACKGDKRDRAIILLLLDPGIRATELCNLNVGDLDIKTGSVTVHQGKGQKDRTTFVGATTRKAIKRHLMERDVMGQREPLFVSKRGGKRLTYFGLAQMLKRLKRDAKVESFSAHALRRSFAIRMLRGGCDIFVLARLMGHTDITVLRSYLDILTEDLQNAHGDYGPVDNL
jgi:site-specific recombinase XerD